MLLIDLFVFFRELTYLYYTNINFFLSTSDTPMCIGISGIDDVSCLRGTTGATQIGEVIASDEDETLTIKPKNVVGVSSAENNEILLKTYAMASMSGRKKTHGVWGFFKMHPEDGD